MKHAKVSRAWRPVRATHQRRRAPQGVLSAFAFNLCMFVLPIAAAAAVIIIGRDHLYAYEYSQAGARVISERIERLNGTLIQLEFDRQRQWDDLVAMELMAGDVPAARGFLLSGGGMLPPRMGQALDRIAGDGDATVELAALDLLTPGTRARYESLVPLLSRRGDTATTPVAVVPPVGGAQDFELMARALLSEPDGDALQFILTGFGLGLAGDFGPRANAGASALLAASRRDGFPTELGAEIRALLGEAVSMETFRNTALAGADGDTAAAFANSAAAFRVAVNPASAARARNVLDEIGAMSQLVSPAAATNLVMHARTLRDLPRLRLLAQATGDRAAAAAKRLPRDGQIVEAARGRLTVNRDLATALAAVGIALAGLVLILLFKGYQAGRSFWLRLQDDDYGAELVDIGENNWRPLS